MMLDGELGIVPEYLIVWNVDNCVELRCDECGHVNHWANSIELDEVLAHAEDHTKDHHA